MEELVDYYLNENGLMVFTAAYHLKRGYCCKNQCKHCPWNYKGGATIKEQGAKRRASPPAGRAGNKKD